MRLSTKRSVSIRVIDTESAVMETERHLAAVGCSPSLLTRIRLADTQLNPRLAVLLAMARYLGATGHRSGGYFEEKGARILIKYPRGGTKLG